MLVRCCLILHPTTRLSNAYSPPLPPFRYTDNTASDYVLLDAVIQKLAASTVADYSRPLILAMIEQMEENGDVMFDAEEDKVYQV